MKTIKVFNPQEKPDVSLLKYDAGWVYQNGDEFFITEEQAGAEETFSIGQAVYDKEGNLLGYLGISLLKSLNYYFRQNAHTQTHPPLHTSIGPWQFSWRFVPNIYEKQNLLYVEIFRVE